MQFESETEALFNENPALEAKMDKLRHVMQRIVLKIEADPGIKVSFGVFEGIKALAVSEVRRFRGLRVLKDVKSSFVPSFESKATEEETKEAAAT